MRSHTLARALLRTAVRAPASRAMARPMLPTAATAPAAQLASAQAFSSSSRTLKKKVKKTLAVDEDFGAEHDEDSFAIEEDDLFGSVSDSGVASSSAASASAASEGSRVELVKALEDYRASLEWEVLDSGRKPSLSRWRALAGAVATKDEVDQLLDIAKLYRDRVGSLGLESGRRLAARAAKIRLPELALNAFLDRYVYGLEYDLESLYLLQSALARKLELRNRDEILASAQLPGTPEHVEDLFGMVQAKAEEGEEGKAQVISKQHELDMEFARAQVALLDRMTMLTTLAQTLRPGIKTYDALLLSYLPWAYIRAFRLTSNRSTCTNPLLTKVFQRTDQLVSLLTVAAQEALTNPAPQAYLTEHNTLVHKRSVRLYQNLVATLTYVAMRGTDGFKTPSGAQIDPVRTLYTYMDTIAPEESNTLIRDIEPRLQTYDSKRPLAQP